MIAIKRQKELMMNQFILNNKVSKSPSFELGDVPFFDELPQTGIALMRLVMEDGFGVETVLVLYDKTPYVSTLAEINPLELMLKSGMVRTSNGPVIFLFFYVPNADTPNDPDFAYVYHANPFDADQMATLRGLAHQSHWHVILVDADQIPQSVLEFDNDFPLAETLADNVDAISNMQPGNFLLAAREFGDKHTVQDLLNMRSSLVSNKTPMTYTLEIIPGKSVGPFHLGMTIQEINDAMHALSAAPITLDDLGINATFGPLCEKLQIRVVNNKHQFLLSGSSVNDIERGAAWDLLASLGAPVLRGYASYDVPEQGISATRWERSDDEIYCFDVEIPTNSNEKPENS
jgi:hypothetical protein